MPALKFEKKQNILIAIVVIAAIICAVFFFGVNHNGKKVVGTLDTKAAYHSYSEIEELQRNNIHAQELKKIGLGEDPGNLGLRAMAQEAFYETNEIREQAGLSPLAWNDNLENPASMVRAEEASQYFSHTRPNGQSWWTVDSDLCGGENLAYGYNSADEVVTAWMNSPTHAQNILHSRFTNAAITAYQAGDGTIYWAQEFGY